MGDANSLYRSDLIWTKNKRTPDFFAARIKHKTGKTNFWVGLDDRDLDGSWETSDGSPNLPNSDPLLDSGSVTSSTQKCAVMEGKNYEIHLTQ